MGQHADETEDDPRGKQAGLAADVEPGNQFHVVEAHDFSLLCETSHQIDRLVVGEPTRYRGRPLRTLKILNR